VSDFTAIAAVTATLQSTLQESVQGDVAGATVTTVRPAEGENTNLPTTGVNVFLYQVTPNPHWRNNDLPARRGDGALVQRPQAAVDLNYLFSFYGGDVMLEPQRLMGSTLAFLHSQPLLTREQIETAVADNSRPFLAGSDLAEQVDLVRFAPLALSLEDLSRLWSVFFQIKYVLSIAFRASVVLIERQETPEPMLPAREVAVTAQPLRRPRIRRVRAAAGEDEPILPGEAIRVEGDELRAEVMRVDVDGSEVAVDEVIADALVVTLPAGLAAGAHSLQVRHGADLPGSPEPHLVFASNVAPFVVLPRVTGVEVDGATITVEVEPDVGAEQLVTLELLTDEGVVHTFLAPEREADAAEVEFDIEGVAAGTYVVRVRVDGAGSPVETDDDGNPTAPEATVP
jgi:Pvc16 N-terminal domain